MVVENWVIGVTLSTVGCTMSNMGVNLQKLTHNRIQKEVEITGIQRSAYVDPLWMLGLASVIVGSVCDLVAFGFADMSLLAPLGAMTLVINMLIAPCFLGEKLTIRDVIATAIILGGTILSLAFGSKSETSYTLDMLMDMFFETLFLIYATLASVLIIAIFTWLYYLKTLRQQNAYIPETSQRAERLLFPFLAGFCGAHSVLFAKAAAEVVKKTIEGESQFGYVGSYFLLIGLGAFLFMQMRFLNEALERCDALLVVPVYQVCWVIMNTIVGMSYFQDYKTMTSVEVTAFSSGVLITVFGVYILAQRDSKPETAHLLPSDDELDTTPAIRGHGRRNSFSNSSNSGYSSRNSDMHLPLSQSPDILSVSNDSFIQNDLRSHRGPPPRGPMNNRKGSLHALNMDDHNMDLHLAEQVERDLHAKSIHINGAVDAKVAGLANDEVLDNAPEIIGDFHVLNTAEAGGYHPYPTAYDSQLDPVATSSSSALGLIGATSILSVIGGGRRSRSSSFSGAPPYSRRTSVGDSYEPGHQRRASIHRPPSSEIAMTTHTGTTPSNNSVILEASKSHSEASLSPQNSHVGETVPTSCSEGSIQSQPQTGEVATISSSADEQNHSSDDVVLAISSMATEQKTSDDMVDLPVQNNSDDDEGFTSIANGTSSKPNTSTKNKSKGKGKRK